MRELARDWMASITSFARGYGGGERANASVGVAFVIGALVVAVLGLRWISASGPTEEAADDTPWDFGAGNDAQTTGTTIPASLPAEIVVVRDPGAPSPTEPVVTLPEGQEPVFLPGFPPTPGGTTGTTRPGSSGTTGTNPPATSGPGSTASTSQPTVTFPGPTTSSTPSTSVPTTPSSSETTTPPSSETTTPPTSDDPPDSGLLGLGLDVGLLGDGLAGAIDGLGRLLV
ncbi:MAG TPA: hypothetical protein VIL36_06830 [Acidimicrobiales bacterium]